MLQAQPLLFRLRHSPSGLRHFCSAAADDNDAAACAGITFLCSAPSKDPALPLPRKYAMLLWFDGNVQVLAGASLYALCNVGQEALLGGIRCLRSQYAAPVRLWQTAKAACRWPSPSLL